MAKIVSLITGLAAASLTTNATIDVTEAEYGHYLLFQKFIDNGLEKVLEANMGR